MMGVQKERFQQLVAVSVMDIWRKETGSQLPVFLEGTICITSCSGRMTVLQLSNRCPVFQTYPFFSRSPPLDAASSNETLSITAPKSSGTDREGSDVASNDGCSVSGCCKEGGCEKEVDGRREEVVDENNNQLCYETCPVSSFPKASVAASQSAADDDADDDDDVFVDDVEDDKISVCDDEGSLELHGKDHDNDEDGVSRKNENRNLISSERGNHNHITTDSHRTNYNNNNTNNNNYNDNNNYNSNDDNDDSAIQDMSFHKKQQRHDNYHNDKSISREVFHNDSQEICSTQQLRQLQPSKQLQQQEQLAHDHSAFSAQIHNNFKNFILNNNPLLNSNSMFNQKVHFSPTQREVNHNNAPSFNDYSSTTPSNNYNNNDTHKINNPHWPVKMETNDSSTNGNEDNKYSVQSKFMPFLPPFIPSAHSANFFNHLNGLPAMLAAHSSAVAKDLANRSFSVPAFSPKENKSFDLIGQLKNNIPTNRSNSSSAPAPSAEQKIYRCLYCQKTFLFKSKYHEHLPVHTSARPFQCHLCSRTYKYKYDLRVHLRTHLGIPTKSTICPFCSVKFSTNKHLRQHIREEHNEQQRISDQQCAQSLLLAPQAHA